jgi:bacteriorhodopsin
MSRSALRTSIIVLTLITALIHLILLNLGFIRTTGRPDLLFTLNGLGYLGLLGVFLINPVFLARQRRLFHYVFMAFTAVTIVAFLAMGGTGFGGRPFNPLGWATKVVEVLLILALWRYAPLETAG